MVDGSRGGQMADEAYLALRRSILEGRYLPGQHLVEQAVAEELNTSKTPVREALARLKEDGLVDSIPFRGYFIKMISSDDLAEIYQLRELYEGACARSAAESEQHEVVAKQLTNANGAASRGFRDGDLDVVHSSFARFDEILFSQSHNKRLLQEIERILTLIHLAGILTNQIPGRIQKSIIQHEEIIEVIAKGDPGTAEELMRIHVRSLLDEELGRRGQMRTYWSAG